MKGPYKYLVISIALLSRHNNLPGIVNLLLIVVVIVAGIMSVCQLIAWIVKKLDPPMTPEQRNQAAQAYEAQKIQKNPPASDGRVGPPPLP